MEKLEFIIDFEPFLFFGNEDDFFVNFVFATYGSCNTAQQGC